MKRYNSTKDQKFPENKKEQQIPENKKDERESSIFQLKKVQCLFIIIRRDLTVLKQILAKNRKPRDIPMRMDEYMKVSGRTGNPTEKVK